MKKRSIFLIGIIFVTTFFIGRNVVLAQWYGTPAISATNAIAACMGAVEATPLPDTCEGTVVPVAAFTCTGGIEEVQKVMAKTNKALQECIKKAEEENAGLVTSSDWIRFVEGWAREYKRDAWRTGFAAALKTSLSTFAKTFAYDTATWVASGGKGQKPLFITEGWGPYLTNAVDTTVGDFIDRGFRNMGMDICQPDFQVSLDIMLGIDWRAPRKPRCSISTIVNNWRQEITDPNFSFNHDVSFRPGENDVSAFLIAQSRLFNQVQWDLTQKILEGSQDSMFKPVTDMAGKILTPSKLVADSEFLSREQSNAGHEIFTNTLWDFVDTFVNTLVGTLLDNLMSGFFSGGSIGNRDSRGGYSGLYDADSAPYNEGVEGARSRYLNIINNKEYTNGEVYDILSKLTTCTDESRNNPGPTDCVLDSSLAAAIREKKLVMDLPASILDRPFAPAINQVTDPQTAFTMRNITIMRTYRIVPAGWEIAAKYISQSDNKGYTLRNVMAEFDNGDSPFYQLVDPFWVMKAPELFCRRQGYGPDLSQANEATVNRDEYCADTQQCIKEDDNGKCLAFGYCTEEKRVWDFNGTSCQPRFNTCQTFTSAQGATASYLANTLDYQNCNAQNAGCKWYSDDFNPVSNYWGDSATSSTNYYNLKKCKTPDTSNGCHVTGAKVKLWHSVSEDNKVVMATPCDTANSNYNATTKTCDYTGTGIACDIPVGGVRCQVNECAGPTNYIDAYNADFSTCTGWEANYWSLGYQASNKKHSCIADAGRTNNALEVYSIGGNTAIVSTLPLPNTIEANSKYSVKFYAKGNLSAGAIAVDVFSGSVLGGGMVNAGNVGTDWRVYEFEFTTQNAGTATIRITTIENTAGTVYFDDFDLRTVDENCSKGLIWLTKGLETEKSPTTIFFDNDTQTCSSDKEGCSQFIRTKAGLESNLIPNSGFEIGSNGIISGWTSGNTATSFDQSDQVKHGGQYSLHMPLSDVGTYAVNLGGPNIALLENRKYILSGWVYASSSGNIYFWDGKAGGSGNDRKSNSYDMANKNQWQKLEVVIDTGITESAILPQVRAVIAVPDAGEVWFDDLKLEEVPYDATSASDYTDYNPSVRPASQLAYLKKAPDYYNCYLYNDANHDGTWPALKDELRQVLSGKNPACANYSGVCTPEEVGCDLYKPIIKDDLSIPATVTSNDLCPGECVGYKVYLQEETSFVASSYNQFIANETPKYCSAAHAGCDEFTNLDTLAKGGESKEYYTKLRSCQKPQDVNDGADFYTWEGSDTTGYQLKSYKLKNTQANSLYSQSPCTNLAYNQSGTDKGKNYCQDIASYSNIENTTLGGLLKVAMPALSIGGNDLRAYLDAVNASDGATGNPITSSTALNQTLVNELHKYGVCVKQELHGYYYYNSETNDLISINQNPDCREFYSVGGQVTYRLLSKTILISDDCHPYRRTQTQGNESTVCPGLAGATVPAVQCDCASTGGYWNDYNECVYMAIPGGGTTCPAEFAKCREYTGNKGYNSRNIFLDDFENGASNWVNGTLSPEANSPGGTSLSLKRDTNELKKNVFVKSNKSYTLSFWAKIDASPDAEIKYIRFSGAQKENYFAINTADGVNLPVSRVKVTSNWQRYELGPVLVNWMGDGYQDIEINTGGRKIFIDNVLLKQVTDDIFLVEDSWFTPQKCDNKLSDPDGSSCGGVAGSPGRCSPGEMVGCSTYTNVANQMMNLKSFNQLCRPEAVGCEALIDTKNSDSPYEEKFNQGANNKIEGVTVGRDELVYMVNNSAVACDGDSKGCTAYGLPRINNRDEVVGYNKTYLKNQPDRYQTDLCKLNELWCDAFSTGRSQAYFKDPRNKVCENRYQLYGTTTISQWFKKGSDEECVVSPYQTIGTGSKAEKEQPIGWFDNAIGGVNNEYTGWAGACPSGSSGCAEYIDPLARMYSELIYNGDFKQDVNDDKKPDGWSATYLPGNDLVIKSGSQNINLKSDSLYTLWVASSGNMTTIISCPDAKLWSPDSSMTYQAGNDDSVMQMIRNEAGDVVTSGRFYFERQSATSCTVTVTAGNRINSVKLVPTGVYYNLDQSVDRSSCNGLVDFKNGCVLFNNRSNINYSSSDNTQRVRNEYLNFDVDKTDFAQLGGDKVSPVVAESDEQKNSNDIIKVLPNRQCDKWLYCNTYEKGDKNNPSSLLGANDKCLNIGLCSAMNDQGECINYIVKTDAEKGYIDNYSKKDVNKTGYAVVGGKIYKGKDKDKVLVATVNGYYPFDLMSQAGESGEVANGNFASVIGETKEPLGWYTDDEADNEGWQDYKYTVETNKKDRKEGVSYLQLNSIYRAESEEIEVDGGRDYVLSFWVNTNYLQPKDAIAIVYIIENNKDGKTIATTTSTTTSSMGWQHIVKNWRADSQADTVNIKLLNWLDVNNDNICDNKDGDKLHCDLKGNTLFDDISLKPVLKVNGKADLSSGSVTRSCRIYPQRDATSCKYITDKNIYYGWYGYCLTEDPQNPNVCLQWWPIENPKGEIMDEVTSYGDRVPLYYCLKATLKYYPDFICIDWPINPYVSCKADGSMGNVSDVPVSNIKIGEATENTFDKVLIDAPGECNPPPEVKVDINADYVKGCEFAWIEAGGSNDSIYGFQVRRYGTDEWLPEVPIDTEVSARGRYVDIKEVNAKLPPNVLPISAIDGVRVTCIEADGHICEFHGFRYRHAFDNIFCDLVVKTVTETGLNKAWSSRMTKGSAYVMPEPTSALYAYQSSYSPFGSIKAPEPQHDPRMWNSSSIKGKRERVAIKYGNDGNSASAGLPLSIVVDSPNNSFNDEFKIDDYFGRCSITRSLCVMSAPDLMGCQVNEKCERVNAAAYNSETAGAELLKNLFVKYYGVWRWKDLQVDKDRCVNNKCATSERDCTDDYDCIVPDGYKKTTLGNIGWTIPEEECKSPVGQVLQSRPANDALLNNKYCFIQPRIESIKLNGLDSAVVEENGVIKLSFNTIVDPDQTPIKEYSIGWGDGSTTTVSGLNLRSRTNSNNPFELYHYYDYWQTVSKNDKCKNINDDCKFNVSISVKDNWNKTASKLSGELMVKQN